MIKGGSAAVPMNVLTKKLSARAEGLKEGIGCMPMDGNLSCRCSIDRYDGNEEDVDTMETKRTLVVQLTRTE